MIVFLCILLIILLTGCSVPQEQLSIQPCSTIPSPRACATCFVYGGQAYVFGGRAADGTNLNDLWRYDPSADTWTSLGATPLPPRLNATACVANGCIYIGLGYVREIDEQRNIHDTYFRDWYRYTPETQSFVSLAPYPNETTDKAICWALANSHEPFLYVGYGFHRNYTRDIFRYDIAADRWDSIDTHVSYMGYPARSFGGVGAVCHGRLFAGTGYRRVSLRWWAELVPDTDNPLSAHWEHRADVPSPERTLAACAATDEAVYLAGGLHYGGLNTTGKVLQDVLRYAPDTDCWTRIATLPEPLCNHLMFRIGKDIYIGIGETWHDDQLLVTPKLYRLHAD